jgi:hypothetical protein
MFPIKFRFSLAKQFQRRRFLEIYQSETRIARVGHQAIKASQRLAFLPVSKARTNILCFFRQCKYIVYLPGEWYRLF